MLIPGVRLISARDEHTLNNPGAGDDTTDSHADGDFVPQHQLQEVAERWANEGCVWFRCTDCGKLRRLTDRAGQQGHRQTSREPASGSTVVPARCADQLDTKRRKAACSPTDDWLHARLGGMHAAPTPPAACCPCSPLRILLLHLQAAEPPSGSRIGSHSNTSRLAAGSADLPPPPPTQRPRRWRALQPPARQQLWWRHLWWLESVRGGWTSQRTLSTCSCR